MHIYLGVLARWVYVQSEADLLGLCHWVQAQQAADRRAA